MKSQFVHPPHDSSFRVGDMQVTTQGRMFRPLSDRTIHRPAVHWILFKRHVFSTGMKKRGNGMLDWTELRRSEFCKLRLARNLNFVLYSRTQGMGLYAEFEELAAAQKANQIVDYFRRTGLNDDVCQFAQDLSRQGETFSCVNQLDDIRGFAHYISESIELTHV